MLTIVLEDFGLPHSYGVGRLAGGSKGKSSLTENSLSVYYGFTLSRITYRSQTHAGSLVVLDSK